MLTNQQILLAYIADFEPLSQFQSKNALHYIIVITCFCPQVSETTHQVGRISVSTTPDVPYREMASHCEALLMGKQQKMSGLISSQKRQECLMHVSLQSQTDEVTTMVSCPNAYADSLGVLPTSSKFITTQGSICSCMYFCTQNCYVSPMRIMIEQLCEFVSFPVSFHQVMIFGPYVY